MRLPWRVLVCSYAGRRLRRQFVLRPGMRLRQAMFNVWRSIGSTPVLRLPLALCAAGLATLPLPLRHTPLKMREKNEHAP
eukprot:2757615-Rhodomonas_salina.1